MEYNVFREKLMEWSSAPHYFKKYKVKTADGTSTRRLFIGSSGVPCEFARRSKSRGYRLTLSDIHSVVDFQPVKAADQVRKFHRACGSIAALLEASGLWADLLPCFQQLRDATVDDVREFYDASGSWTEQQNARDAWMQRRGLDRNHISSDLMRGIVDKGLVSIPYDRLERDERRRQLAGKISAREEFRHRWRGSYDYSVSGEVGKDGIMRAWYSAEFKDCGNGHYYLMLDERHAIHAEDD